MMIEILEGILKNLENGFLYTRPFPNQEEDNT